MFAVGHVRPFQQRGTCTVEFFPLHRWEVMGGGPKSAPDQESCPSWTDGCRQVDNRPKAPEESWKSSETAF